MQRRQAVFAMLGRFAVGIALGAIGFAVLDFVFFSDIHQRLFVPGSFFEGPIGALVLAAPIGLIASRLTAGWPGLIGLWLGSTVAASNALGSVVGYAIPFVSTAALLAILLVPLLPLPGYLLGRRINPLLARREGSLVGRLVILCGMLVVSLGIVAGIAASERLAVLTARQPVCPKPNDLQLTGQLAFVGAHSICVANLQDGSVRAIYESPVDKSEVLSGPAWSPDGRSIVFVRRIEPDQRVATPAVEQILIADIKGGPPREVAGPYGDTCFKDPAFSPDGTRLAAAICIPGDGAPFLFVLGLSENRWTRVDIAGTWDVANPDWSLDGKTILVAARRHEGAEYSQDSWIYSVDPDGSYRARLAQGSWNPDPAWSPDGSSILYGGRVGERGSYELLIASRDGASQRRLTYAADDGDPISANGVWAPDGQHIAFHRYASNEFPHAIWVISTIGGTPLLLVEGGTDPAWLAPSS